MSIEDEQGRGPRAEGKRAGSLPLERKRRYASAAFITLLTLSVFWPSPVVSVNRLWMQQPLDVDELSFLGREAPSWDVVFWFFAGVLLLMILQSAESHDYRQPLVALRTLRFDRTIAARAAVRLLGGALFTLLVWVFADQRVLAWAEGVQSDAIEDVIRIVNRLGGGMNPVLIVAFFLVAGVAYRERRWVSYAIAMAMSGLGAGILVQIIKHLVGRARPELWLGPSHWAPGSSTSFPSGHTVGAFALAGVLVFASRSLPLRTAAFLLAFAVGMARVLAFRHWMSDVVASMVLGLLTAWIATHVVLRNAEGVASIRAVPEQ